MAKSETKEAPKAKEESPKPLAASKGPKLPEPKFQGGTVVQAGKKMFWHLPSAQKPKKRK